MPNSAFTLSATPEACSAWECRLDKFNAGSGESALTLLQYLQARFDDNSIRYAAQQLDEQKMALAGNARMVAIGTALLQMDEVELDTKLTAFENMLP